jgi:hypothetical protein
LVGCLPEDESARVDPNLFSVNLIFTDFWVRYNAASVYFDWALMEGQEGVYNSAGVFDIGLFLQVAKEAGIFIIAVG